MDIANLSMNMSQSNIMNQVSTNVLAMSLDNLEKTGTNMISEVPVQNTAVSSGVMNSEHIDMLV